MGSKNLPTNARRTFIRAVWRVSSPVPIPKVYFSMLPRCVSALILLLPVVVRADVGPATVPVLEELRVVGSRDTSMLATGDYALVIDGEEQLTLGRSVADWIAQLPGVSLNGQGGLLQAYSVRGFSRARVRTEVDGVPILSDRRAGNSASFIPPDLLQSVAIDSSAASALYGSGALGGVVHMQTLQSGGTAIKGQVRSNDELAALTLASADEQGTLALSLRRAGKAEAPNGHALNTGFEQAALLLRGTSQWRELDISYSWLPSVGRDIGRSNSAYPDVQVSTTPEEFHSLGRVELRSSDRLLRLYHHYQDWDSDVQRETQRNLTRYRGHTIGGLFLGGLDERGGSWGIEWLGRRDVEITEREITAVGTPLLAQRVVDGDEDTVGLFIDQRWRAGDVEIKGALRLDHVSQRATESDRELQPSASLGLNYHRHGWTAGVELARAFRFPSLSERYFRGTTPRGEIRGNPDLEPELRHNLEFSLCYDSAGEFSAAFSAYASSLDDYIERVALTDTQLSYQNVDEAELWGVELDLRWRTGALAHQLSYQWQRGEDRHGEPLADLNPPAWRYFASWNLAALKLRSDLSYRPSRHRSGRGELPLDDAVVWGLAVAVEGAGGFSWELQLNNVLDETYRGSADSLAPLQPGRSLSLVLRWAATGA